VPDDQPAGAVTSPVTDPPSGDDQRSPHTLAAICGLVSPCDVRPAHDDRGLRVQVDRQPGVLAT
jgi:hypothetical protein